MRQLTPQFLRPFQMIPQRVSRMRACRMGGGQFCPCCFFASLIFLGRSHVIVHNHEGSQSPAPHGPSKFSLVERGLAQCGACLSPPVAPFCSMAGVSAGKLLIFEISL